MKIFWIMFESRIWRNQQHVSYPDLLMTIGYPTNLLSTLASWPSIDTNDDNDVTLVWHTVSMYLLSVHYQLQDSVMQPLQNTSGVMNDNWHSLLWLANIGDDIHIWKLLKLLFYTFTYNCAPANDANNRSIDEIILSIFSTVLTGGAP